MCRMETGATPRLVYLRLTTQFYSVRPTVRSKAISIRVMSRCVVRGLGRLSMFNHC